MAKDDKKPEDNKPEHPWLRYLTAAARDTQNQKSVDCSFRPKTSYRKAGAMTELRNMLA